MQIKLFGFHIISILTNVLQAKLLQRQVGSSDGIVVAVVIVEQLGCDKDIFSGDAATKHQSEKREY